MPKRIQLCWCFACEGEAVGALTIWNRDGFGKHSEAKVQACERHAGRRINVGFTEPKFVRSRGY